MTSELPTRGCRVSAMDRAPLDARCSGCTGYLQRENDESARDEDGWNAKDNSEGINGSAIQFGKETSKRTYRAVSAAATGGLALITPTHLTYNRQEFALFFQQVQRASRSGEGDAQAHVVSRRSVAQGV